MSLLGAHCVPGSVLGTEDRLGKERDQCPAHLGCRVSISVVIVLGSPVLIVWRTSGEIQSPAPSPSWDLNPDLFSPQATPDPGAPSTFVWNQPGCVFSSQVRSSGCVSQVPQCPTAQFVGGGGRGGTRSQLWGSVSEQRASPFLPSGPAQGGEAGAARTSLPRPQREELNLPTPRP